ncbi:hypothetical protein PAMP_015200 [Pampus punctatissimus]
MHKERNQLEGKDMGRLQKTKAGRETRVKSRPRQFTSAYISRWTGGWSDAELLRTTVEGLYLSVWVDVRYLAGLPSRFLYTSDASGSGVVECWEDQRGLETHEEQRLVPAARDCEVVSALSLILRSSCRIPLDLTEPEGSQDAIETVSNAVARRHQSWSTDRKQANLPLLYLEKVVSRHTLVQETADGGNQTLLLVPLGQHLYNLIAEPASPIERIEVLLVERLLVTPGQDFTDQCWRTTLGEVSSPIQQDVAVSESRFTTFATFLPACANQMDVELCRRIGAFHLWEVWLPS